MGATKQAKAATACAGLVAPWEKLRRELKPAGPEPALKLLARSYGVSQGWLPLRRRVWSMLGINSSRASRLSRAESQGDTRAGQTVLAKLMENDRFLCLPALGQPRGRTTQQENNGTCQHFNPKRVTTDCCPSGPYPEVSELNYSLYDPSAS